MSLEKHDLVHDMPQSKAAIHHLKRNDLHFAKLFDEYHAVEHEVHRYEAGGEHTSDDHLETLKKQRVHLKDRLTSMVRDYESSASH